MITNAVVPQIHPSHTSSNGLLAVRPSVVSFFCMSLCSILIRMLCWIKDIDWELQEQSPLQDDRHSLIKSWWEGDEDTGLMQVSSILVPTFTLFVSLLRSRAFLQG